MSPTRALPTDMFVGKTQYSPTGSFPASAEWIPGTYQAQWNGQGQYVVPVNATRHHAMNAAGQFVAWDAWNGWPIVVVPSALQAQLAKEESDLTAAAVVDATSPAADASSLEDAYNPASVHFGNDIQLPITAGGGFQRFDPTQAVSVAGRMANLGEDFATASARASAAATKLGAKVIPVPPPTMTAPVVPSAATPPGLKLPVNPPMPTLPVNPPMPTLPVNPPMPTLPLNADRPPAAPTYVMPPALPGEPATPTKAITAPPAAAPTGNAFVDAIQAHAGAIAAAILAILLLLSGRGGE